MSRRWCGWFGGLSVCAMGCATFGTHQTADTLGKGNKRYTIVPSLVDPLDDTVPSGHVEMSGVTGVSDSIDIGLRGGLSGLGVTSKFRLFHDETSQVTVSIAPSVGGGGFPVLGFVTYAQVPVIVGYDVGAGHQVVLAPKAHLLNASLGFVDLERHMARMVSVGSTLAFSAYLGGGFRLMPEIGVMFPVSVTGTDDWASQDIARALPAQGESVLMQLSLGALFGPLPPAGADATEESE